MKKLLILVVTIIAILFPVKRVFAGTAAFSTQKRQDVVKIKEEPVEIPATRFGYSVEGVVTPLVNEVPLLIAIPDIRPYAVYYKKITPWAQSVAVQKKVIDFTNTNPVSAKYCIKVVLDPPHMDQITAYALTDTTTEVSKDWPESRIAGQNEEILAGWNGLWKKIPTADGHYDYNYPTHVLADITTADCGVPTTVAVPVNTMPPLTAVQLASFLGHDCSGSSPANCATLIRYYSGPPQKCPKPGPHGTIIWVYCWAPVPIHWTITRKSVDGHFTNLQAKSGRCNSNDTSDAQTGTICDERGQWTSGFVPKQIFDAPYQPHAQVKQEEQFSGIQMFHIVTLEKFNPITFDTAFKNTHSAMEDTKTATCFVTPRSEQDKLKIGNSSYNVSFNQNCGPTPAPTLPPVPKCPIDVILDQNPPQKDKTCGLCANAYPKDNDILTALEQSAFPSGMPNNLVKVLEFVGGLYSVPPAVILGNMLEEGSFEHAPTWQWTDQTVRDYSLCTTPNPMSSCDSFANPSGAKGPLGLFQSQIDGATGSNDPYAPLKNDPLFKDVLANRPKGTFSACNFLDAAMYAAWDIHTSQSHLYVPGVPNSCTLDLGDPTIYPISQATDIPGSCSVWDAARVGLARYQYGGYKYDPAEQLTFCSGIARTENTFSTYNCSK